MNALFALWRVMFGLTLLLELPIVVLSVPREKRLRAAMAAIVGNAITHPLLWFGWPRLLSGTPLLIVGETCAVLLEGVAYATLGGLDRRRAFYLALAANLYSWGIGEVINRAVFPTMARYFWG